MRTTAARKRRSVCSLMRPAAVTSYRRPELSRLLRSNPPRSQRRGTSCRIASPAGCSRRTSICWAVRRERRAPRDTDSKTANSTSPSVSPDSIHQVYGPTVRVLLQLGEARNPRLAGTMGSAARCPHPPDCRSCERLTTSARFGLVAPCRWSVSPGRCRPLPKRARSTRTVRPRLRAGGGMRRGGRNDAPRRAICRTLQMERRRWETATHRSSKSR